MPRVSVILPTYNQGKYLNHAIVSVATQTYEDWELFVMDDGSTDGTEAVLDHWAEHSKVTVVRCQPIGPRLATVRYAENINLAAERATGEYITYLSGDDWYLPDRLERMLVTCSARLPLKTEVVYGQQDFYNEPSDPDPMFPRTGHVGVRATRGLLTDAWHKVDMSSVLHTRDSFERAKGWPTGPEHWRDADGRFWQRLGALGLGFWPVPGGSTDVHRFHSGSVDQRLRAGLAPC